MPRAETVHAEIRYYGAAVAFLKHDDKPAATAEPSSGSQDDRHIHHPALGQIDTGGNRFAAILKASNTLHSLQAGTRFATETRLRAMSRLPALRAAEDASEQHAAELARRRQALEAEFEAVFGQN